MMYKNFPMWRQIEIDLHSFCNRDCVFCPRHSDMSGVRKNKYGNKIRKRTPSEKIYDIINQAYELGFKGNISLHRLSEPFLDSRYVDFAKYAKSKGLSIQEFTNGDVLRNNIQLCKKIDGLIDTLIIGLYDYETYNQKDKEMQFWKSRFKKTKVQFSLPREKTRIRQGSKFHSSKRWNPALNRPCKVTDLLLIRYDGEVALCCEDDKCSFNLGNAFEKSLKDIWWSEKHINIVNDLQKSGGRRKFKLCKNCYVYTNLRFRKQTKIRSGIKKIMWRFNLIKLKPREPL